MRWRTVPLVVFLTLAGPVVFEGASPGRAAAAEAFSLVFEGRISDVPVVRTPQGTYLSLAALAGLLKQAGGSSVDVRADRGLVVVDTRREGVVAELKGFTTSDITLMINEANRTTRAELVDGVPYIRAEAFEWALKMAGFQANVSEDNGLVTASRPPTSAVPPPPAPGAPSAPPPNPLEQAVMQGASDALRMLSTPAAPVDLSRAPAVCGAMDQLRQAWQVTEPTRQEKETFQDLAERFQQAQGGQGNVTVADAIELERALLSFKAKVDQRARSTAAWKAPTETTQVQMLGNQFLGVYSGMMDTMADLAHEMTEGHTLPPEEIDKAAEQLKEMERQIQSLGARFDAEVTRVRTGYGCGPATLRGTGS